MDRFSYVAHYVGLLPLFFLTTPLLIVDKVSPISYLSTRRHDHMPINEPEPETEDGKDYLRTIDNVEEEED